MATFADLSEYSYIETGYAPRTFNVGWIEASEVQSRWEAPSEFLQRLWSVSMVEVASTRGSHPCDFCDLRGSFVRNQERYFRFGIGEIRVFGKGVIFAAPNLLHHYIKTHGYKPPSLFIDAVMDGPIPPDQSYFDLLKHYGLVWKDCYSGPIEEILNGIKCRRGEEEWIEHVI